VADVDQTIDFCTAHSLLNVDVSEERIVCILRLNELVQMDAKVTLRKQIKTLLDS